MTNSVVEGSLRTDPGVAKLLEKVPANMRGSFSDEQLLALKVAVGGRSWGARVRHQTADFRDFRCPL